MENSVLTQIKEHGYTLKELYKQNTFVLTKNNTEVLFQLWFQGNQLMYQPLSPVPDEARALIDLIAQELLRSPERKFIYYDFSLDSIK